MKKDKKGLKRKLKETNVTDKKDEVPLPTTRFSDEPVPKKVKWINKQRVLVFATRSINYRHRHLMEDLKTLMPQARSENKMERQPNLFVVNEICGMKNCNKCILFDGRHLGDLYMWISNVPQGPSVKFLVENVHTMRELKLTGNCLKGSRPLLSFDTSFTSTPYYEVLKELLTQVFGTPYHHPKSQPFTDHVITFTILDNRIWFRNFQILNEDGALAEIGPRFVMNPVKIFSSSFGGETLWENPHFVTPAKHRRMVAKAAGGKYMNRVDQKLAREVNKPEFSYKFNKFDEIFSEELPFEDQQANTLTPQPKLRNKKKKKKGINKVY